MLSWYFEKNVCLFGNSNRSLHVSSCRCGTPIATECYVLWTHGDCCRTLTIFCLSVVLWRSADSSGELKVAWVGAVCVVEKCVASRNFGLLGELNRHLLTRVCVCLCVYIRVYISGGPKKTGFSLKKKIYSHFE